MFLFFCYSLIVGYRCGTGVLPGISLEPIYIPRGQCCLDVDVHIRSSESLIHFSVLPLEPLVQGQRLPRYSWGTRIYYTSAPI